MQGTPGRKALLHTSAAKWPHDRASGYPSAFTETQTAKTHCDAGAESSATHKRGHMAECPRQRVPKRGVQNPKATRIAKAFGFQLRIIAAKYANHRTSG